MAPVIEPETLKYIGKLKVKKALGRDSLKNEHINSHFITPHSCHIFNNYIQNTIFPSVLKVTTVVLIHKKGDKYRAENYRNVSVTSVFAKLFEQLLKDRIVGGWPEISFSQNGHRYKIRQ